MPIEPETPRKRKKRGWIPPLDRPCARCGYDIRGQGDEQVCPECATPVRLSRMGSLLAGAGEDSLRRLRFGSRVLMWTMLTGAIVPLALVAVMMLFAFVFDGTALDSELAGIMLVVSFVGLIVGGVIAWALGWRAIARACEDDRLAATSPLFRRVAGVSGWWVLVCMGLTTVAGVIEEMGVGMPPIVPVGLSLAGLAFWTAGACCGMMLVNAVLERTDERGARRQARSLIWLSPSMLVGMLPSIAAAFGSTQQSWMSFFGCISVIGWLWLIFGASTMLILARVAKKAIAVRAEMERASASIPPPAAPTP